MNRPRVLLLDEPLGALDLKLREEMQIELKAIQQERGDHLHLRDPRSGGGAHDERPSGGLQRDGSSRSATRRTCTSDRRRGSWPASLARPTCSPVRSGSEPSRARTARITVRPEKIHLADRDSDARADEASAPERSATSSIWDRTRDISWSLDAGGELVVTQQNLATSSMEALAAKGRTCPSHLEAPAQSARRGRVAVSRCRAGRSPA